MKINTFSPLVSP